MEIIVPPPAVWKCFNQACSAAWFRAVFWGKFSVWFLVYTQCSEKIIPFEVFLLFSPPILLGKLLHGDRLVGRGLLLHLVLEVLLAHNLQVHLRVNKEVTEMGS